MRLGSGCGYAGPVRRISKYGAGCGVVAEVHPKTMLPRSSYRLGHFFDYLPYPLLAVKNGHP